MPSAGPVADRLRSSWRRLVRVVAILNLAYFGIEFAVGRAIGSVSLFVDSIDFLGEPPTGAEAALETRVAAFEDCGTLAAASASTGAINLRGGKMRRVRAVCLPASEGVGPRVRIRLAPAASPMRTSLAPYARPDNGGR